MKQELRKPLQITLYLNLFPPSVIFLSSSPIIILFPFLSILLFIFRPLYFCVCAGLRVPAGMWWDISFIQRYAPLTDVTCDTI